MKRRLSVLEQGRLWEARWLRQQRHLRERQRGGHRMRFRESTARHHRARVRESMAARQRHRMTALARRRPDLLATIAFHEAYHSTSVRGRKRPASDAIATFREVYRRP